MKGEALRKTSSVKGIGAARSGVWTIAWTVLLAVAMVVLLALCGGSETADADTREYDYGEYNEWDADNNDEVAEEEFYGGVYECWDEDDSGYVDTDEYEAGIDAYYEDYEYGAYDEWDANDDDTVNENEFDNRTARS